jgi:hypothetical protein
MSTLAKKNKQYLFSGLIFYCLEEQELSRHWTLYHKVRELLKVFQDIRVSKVARVSNGIVHALAQLGRSGSSNILREAAPS